MLLEVANVVLQASSDFQLYVLKLKPENSGVYFPIFENLGAKLGLQLGTGTWVALKSLCKENASKHCIRRLSISQADSIRHSDKLLTVCSHARALDSSEHSRRRQMTSGQNIP